jgi:hypothetical protein
LARASFRFPFAARGEAFGGVEQPYGVADDGTRRWTVPGGTPLEAPRSVVLESQQRPVTLLTVALAPPNGGMGVGHVAPVDRLDASREIQRECRRILDAAVGSIPDEPTVTTSSPRDRPGPRSRPRPDPATTTWS